MSRYTNYEMANNVFGTLSAPISSLATTIQVDTGQGQRFKANMLATLEHVEGNKVTKREIVKITAVAGDALTVVRKYAACPIDDDANTQSQTSFSFDISDTINVYITKEHFDNIKGGLENAESELDDLNYDGNSRMKVIQAISGTALKIDIIAGVYRCGQDTVQFNGQTDISVNDNATNYVMADGAGTIQISTSSWDTRYTRLAIVTCSSGAITSISDRRSDVVGGTLGGLEIHSLTEKISPVNNDELVLADSEDSYVNKRVKVGTLRSIVITNTSNYPSRLGSSDNEKYLIANVSSNNAAQLYFSNNGFCPIRNGNNQIISSPSFGGGNGGMHGAAIHGDYIYICVVVSNVATIFKCNVENDISDINNWTQIAQITDTISSAGTYLYGFDGTYFIMESQSGSISCHIYKYDINFTQISDNELEIGAVQVGYFAITNQYYFIFSENKYRQYDTNFNLINEYYLSNSYPWFLLSFCNQIYGCSRVSYNGVYTPIIF